MGSEFICKNCGHAIAMHTQMGCMAEVVPMQEFCGCKFTFGALRAKDPRARRLPR